MSKYSLKDQMRITWNEDKFKSTLTDGMFYTKSIYVNENLIRWYKFDLYKTTDGFVDN